MTDHPVDFVVVPSQGGELGVLPGHAPFVVQLSMGILRYKDEHKKENFAVLNGFASIHNDKVQVLAESAELAKEVDEERARQEYQKAKDSLAMRGKDMDLDSAQSALKRAVVRMKLAELKRKYK